MKKRSRIVKWLAPATLLGYGVVLLYALLRSDGMNLQTLFVAVAMPLALAAIVMLGRPRKENRLRKRRNTFKLAPEHNGRIWER